MIQISYAIIYLIHNGCDLGPITDVFLKDVEESDQPLWRHNGHGPEALELGCLGAKVCQLILRDEVLLRNISILLCNKKHASTYWNIKKDIEIHCHLEGTRENSGVKQDITLGWYIQEF